MKAKYKALFLVMAVSILAISCSQWRVSSLSSREFSFIDNSDKAGGVAIKTDDGGLEDLTAGVGVFNGKIITSDNVLGRLQQMNSDKEIDLMIGNIKNSGKGEFPASSFNFSRIGLFVVDKAGNIYVQNRITGQKNGRRNDQTGFTPSFLLVFNKNGQLQHTLGQTGSPDVPFNYIENLEIDEKGRLFAISRSNDSWSIFRFTGKKRDLYINLDELEFKEKEGETVIPGKIENILMYSEGEKLILAVAYYSQLRFKFRRIYTYSIEKKKIEKTIMEIPDPKNVLFNVVDDKNLFFWNMDGKDVKFMITDLDGNIINNVRLKIDDSKNLYSKILLDKKGRFYSYHIVRKGIRILEWK